MIDKPHKKEMIDDFLFDGCPLTSQASVLLQLRFTMTHNLTKAARQDLLELISLHCPVPNKCCTTIHQSEVNIIFVEIAILHVEFCDRCSTEVKNRGHFIYLPFEDQLKRIAKRKFYQYLF